MKYDPNYQSNDVEDRRGQGGGGGGGTVNANAVGLLLSLLLRTKYGWVIIILLVVGWFGATRLGLLGNAGTGTGTHGALAPNDTDAHFSAFVFDDTQKFWEDEMTKSGRRYPHATLVLFTDQTPTACGTGDSATGPFYCPGDKNVYIDLGFFQTMSTQLGAQGQFARAYVIAHEIGHHVQNLLGTSAKAERGNVVGASGNSVRLELQADCYAGIWARSADARGLLDRGDLESALNAASRIGDDVLQKEATGRVRPEKFTHGTASQRLRWLKRGFDSGSMLSCDTFTATDL